jgi:hypothetical protein
MVKPKIPRIESCAFGALVFNGRTYTDDLLIFPQGTVQTNWRRRRGHGLCMEDMAPLIDSAPEVIVIGTGVSGMVQPEDSLAAELRNLGIEWTAAPNHQAMETFNRRVRNRRVAAGFHLTC